MLGVDNDQDEEIMRTKFLWTIRPDYISEKVSAIPLCRNHKVRSLCAQWPNYWALFL